MMATPIFLTIGMYIGLTKLLKVGPFNAEYDFEEKFCEGCTGVDWGNDDEIKEAMAADNNKNDDEKES